MVAVYRVPAVFFVEGEGPAHIRVVLVFLDELLEGDERTVFRELLLLDVYEPWFAILRRDDEQVDRALEIEALGCPLRRFFGFFDGLHVRHFSR